MSLLDRDRSLCLVIDFQGKLAQMVERADEVLAGTCRLLQVSSLFEVPVLLSEQYPQGLGPTEASVQQAYDEVVSPKRKIAKTRFGCCGDPGFEAAVAELLPGVASRQFVIAGIEAHICVVQTVLDLLSRGDEVFVCWECVSSRGAPYRRWGIERMRQAGAIVTNHESVGFEWARDKDHPAFREMSRLFRGGQVGADDPI
ncbi:MAG: isochorismatase family protein [Thermoanaerobaculia bacterium]|nr:isochorismatase family protein [Thermoanaerobaculia bacterium]